jgi:hypothetical protein
MMIGLRKGLYAKGCVNSPVFSWLLFSFAFDWLGVKKVGKAGASIGAHLS